MIAYIAKGEWKGIFDPDERGQEEKVFLAYSDEHAREEAQRIARKEDFKLQQILKVTEKGNVEIPLNG